LAINLFLFSFLAENLFLYRQVHTQMEYLLRHQTEKMEKITKFFILEANERGRVRGKGPDIKNFNFNREGIADVV
jgi:hypothetical protein